ncbi:MAG: beta-ketoacyl-[acyl-carrier-protein] synthase family protein [Bifidobacteriaceae bacterium]|jgi:3-oxoacyl-[acyl-carrier-protein] synthase II|nr:beta-ketoacyl-[acyl-carrier-protein] synthase family protein [Bifidobacteriaceae bacterium]
MREVVITGIGATTPLGGTARETWRAALRGDSGVRPVPAEWVERYALPVMFAAFAAVPPADVLPVPTLRKLDRAAQFAIIAAREAWDDAGAPDTEPRRLAAVVGSGIGGVWTMLDAWDTVRERGARRVLPLTIPMLMPNSAAANISVEFGAKAGAHTPVSACASGAEAVVLATRMIRDGRADTAIVGGAEAPIHPMPLAAFAKMRALSSRNDSPATASRPYCATRDGFVMGEGAGMLVLETAERARARGAHVYARVAGVGSTADAYGVAPPDPSGSGQMAAMREALADAGMVGSDIVHVNAHATATPAGDTIEAHAIRAALSDDGAHPDHADRALVSATKSMTGHLLGAAGAVETILTALALDERVAPPTTNIEELDPEVTLTVVRDKPAPLPANGRIAALNNAFGFGGHNTAIVLTTP